MGELLVPKATGKGSASEKRRKSGGTGLNDLFIAVFGVGFVISLSLNVLHLTGKLDSEHSHNTALHQAVQEFKYAPSRHRSDETPNDVITLGTLNCDSYGGPPAEQSQEMVYWHEIPSDAKWTSPFKNPTDTRYLTFEPDGGTTPVQVHFHRSHFTVNILSLLFLLHRRMEQH